MILLLKTCFVYLSCSPKAYCTEILQTLGYHESTVVGEVKEMTQSENVSYSTWFAGLFFSLFRSLSRAQDIIEWTNNLLVLKKESKRPSLKISLTHSLSLVIAYTELNAVSCSCASVHGEKGHHSCILLSSKECIIHLPSLCASIILTTFNHYVFQWSVILECLILKHQSKIFISPNF